VVYLNVDCFVEFLLAPSLTHHETETKMANAFVGFEKYIKYLATGKLDGYLDSIRDEDKVTGLGVELFPHPILLIHNLGKDSDENRIKELFISKKTVCVGPGYS
jgi:hypothetical protein